MKVIELARADVHQLAVVEITRHHNPEEAERIIEQINNDAYHGSERIERLKQAMRMFYGFRRELMFVFSKRPA